MDAKKVETTFEKDVNEIIRRAESWDMDLIDVKREVNNLMKCQCETSDTVLDCCGKQVSEVGNHSDSGMIRSLGYGFWIVLKLLFSIIIIYTIVSCHNPTQKFVMRHSQSLIYPIMRTVRIFTLPVIRKYGSLTEWHEEECLLKNPFYEEPLLDCWPCEDIRSLVDLSGLSNYSQAYCSNERPFIVKDVMHEKVTFDDLRKVYLNNFKFLTSGTAKFVSNTQDIESLNHLFKDEKNDNFPKDLQISWKVNRVSAARIIRQVFHRPYFIPNRSEVALQRFIYIDGPEASHYYYPLTDFANVWLAQGQGYRVIVLEPSETCRSNCSTLSVLLKPKDVLYYNWQFWRPRSVPARVSEELSITYMGSFY